MKTYKKPNIILNTPAENICAEINVEWNSIWNEHDAVNEEMGQ